MHPNNLYCHTRYIYLAISFLYGAAIPRATSGRITEALRRELYSEPYNTIDFAAHCNDIARTDLYVAPSGALRAAWSAMAVSSVGCPRLPFLRAFRRRALARCLGRIRSEQEASSFQALSPVNGILNTIALFAYDPHDPMLEPSLAGVESWRWDDTEDGIRYRRSALDLLGHRVRHACMLARPGEEDRWSSVPMTSSTPLRNRASSTAVRAKRAFPFGGLVLQRRPTSLAGK